MLTCTQDSNCETTYQQANKQKLTAMMRQRHIDLKSKKTNILLLLILWSYSSRLRCVVSAGIDAKIIADRSGKEPRNYMLGHPFDYSPRAKNIGDSGTDQSVDDYAADTKNYGIRRRASNREYTTAAASASASKMGNNGGVGGLASNNGIGVVSKAAANNNGNGNGNLAAALANVGSVNTGGEVMLPKSFPMSAQEPTCEQLRAMWIFSRRQSRAAEMTNEIPTYRDPFAYNIWEPYYSSTRSMGAVRMVPRYGERSRSPVFGRVVSREPPFSERLSAYENQPHQRQRPLTENGKNYRVHNTGVRRPPTQYRYIVGTNGAGTPANTATAASASNPNAIGSQGSFQKLKELIWTERAKDLTQQRRAEELAARAAVLKEIANGKNIQASAAAYKLPYKLESLYMDENRSPDMETSSFQHDGRYNLKNNNKNPAFDTGKMLSLTRSYGNAEGANSGGDKPSIFSSSALGGSAAGRLMLSNLGNYQSVDDRQNINTGVPKAYPMRSSHFRERNRAIFKQHSPTDYFQRDTRNKLLPIEGADAADMDLSEMQDRLQQAFAQFMVQYPYILGDGRSDALSYRNALDASNKNIQNDGNVALFDPNNIYIGDDNYKIDSNESVDEDYEN